MKEHTDTKRRKDSNDTPPSRRITKSPKAQDQPGTYAQAADPLSRVPKGYPEAALGAEGVISKENLRGSRALILRRLPQKENGYRKGHE